MHAKFDACEHVHEGFLAGSIAEYHGKGWDVGCRALLDSALSQHVRRERRTLFGPASGEDFDGHIARTSGP